MDQQQVIPFSNGTDAMVWQEMNCFKCRKYESESSIEEKAGCKLAFNIDLGYIAGEIPLHIAESIGGERRGNYFSLNRKCNEFEEI